MPRAVPNKISLVFCDVDGTLVTDDKRLTAASAQAVRRLGAAGIRFAIGSSRPPRGMSKIVGALDIDMPIAAFNGGLIIERGGAVLVRHLVPRGVAEIAIELFAHAGTEVWAFTPDHWLLRNADGPCVARERHTIGFAPSKVDDFTPHLDEIGKIVGVSEDVDFLAHCENEVARWLGPPAAVVRSQAYYLDVTNPRANKAEALGVLARHCGAAHHEIVAIGDGLNPICARASMDWRCKCRRCSGAIRIAGICSYSVAGAVG